MKILVTIVRIIVGLLFIFSGLVKANDPMGLSYKMQEYFEIWGVHQFNSWTLLIAVLMNAFEIIAGFALLLGWRIRLFSWLLSLLIIFFTFLTGYTYATGKPVNCGCFGDCLPITSKTSFLKDIVLLILVGFLFWKQKMIKPFLSDTLTNIKMAGVTLLSFGFQWYTLIYLPVVDCLPYKKGNSITEKMKMPANAIPDSTVITFLYLKNGKEVEFTADKFPEDFSPETYTLVKRYDKLVRKGKNNEPPIKGFSLVNQDKVDYTDKVLSSPYAVLLFIEKFSDAGSTWKNKFSKIYSEAKAKGISSYIITAEPAKALEHISGTSFSEIPVLTCDYKAIETAARTNPCLFLLEQGTILNKWSEKRMKNISNIIEGLSAQTMTVPEVSIEPADTTNN